MKEYIIIPDNSDDDGYSVTVDNSHSSDEKTYTLRDREEVLVYAYPKDGEGYVINGQFLDYAEIAELLVLLQCMKECDKSLMPNYEIAKLKTIKHF